MIVLLYTIHVLICFFLIAVVLLQQGKGADLSVFGGGATQTAFGARGAATVLHKMTVISFVLFIVTTLGIGIYQSKQGASNLFEGLDEEAAATTTTSGEEATGDEATGEAADEAGEEPQGAFAVDSEDAASDASSDDAATEGEAVEGDASEGDGAGDGTGDADGEATEPVVLEDPAGGSSDEGADS